MKKIIFTFVLCLLIQGCASTLTFKLDPQVLNGQEQISQEGAKAVISQKKARVAIRPLTDTYPSEDRPRFVLSVYGGEEPFNFSTGNIRVFVDGNPHLVFTYDELVADINEQEKREIKKAEDWRSDQYRSWGASAIITKDFDERINVIQNKTQKSLADIDANMLKNATVFPNKWHSGHVIIEKIPSPTQPHKIKVIVTAAGEEHEFLLNHYIVQ